MATLVTELDQAPAATETSDQPPAGEQRPGGTDSQARYPNGVSAADQDPGYYDGDVQAALAADSTPTRQQAARDTGTDHQDGERTAGTSQDSEASSRDPDIEAILHENDHLPEPRTRQEAAREKADGQTAEVSPAESPDNSVSGQDPDMQAILHENDHLPEPRTRQEAAAEARSGTAPLTRGGRDVQPHERDGGEWPSPEERTRLHETYLGWRNEIAEPRQGTGWEQGASVVGDKPDKSPDDRSGLPPTGEELIHLESDDASRLERLGNKIYEEFDDIADVAEKVSNRAQELFDLRPPAGHPEVRVPTQPYVTPTAEQHETPDAGNIAQLGLVLGVIGFRTYQSVRRKLGERKGGSHGGH
jgi:hypothetical protein